MLIVRNLATTLPYQSTSLRTCFTACQDPRYAVQGNSLSLSWAPDSLHGPPYSL